MVPLNTKKLWRVQDEGDPVQFDNVLNLCGFATDSADNKWRDQENAQLATTLLSIAKCLETLQKQVNALLDIAPNYDSKCGVKGNGYRSFVRISGTFVSLLTEHLVSISSKGTSNLSRKDEDELNSFARLLLKLTDINQFALEIRKVSEEHKLFPEPLDINSVEELALKIAHSDFSQFYEKFAGFHYKGDCKNLARPLLAFIASYSDFYHDDTWYKRLVRIGEGLFGIRYAYDMEHGAKKVFKEVKEKQIHFCKSFYNLSEMSILYTKRSRYSVHNESEVKIKANCVIRIPPEKFKIMNTQGAAFQVPVPSSHIGSNQSINARLISPFRSPDMIGACPCHVTWPGKKCSCRIVPSSDSIIFHLHGGGFVSHTSKSHTTYLKQWAKQLGVPILSIDYSLAPEAPFPRAVEEVLYSYCWMRNNFSALGTSGRKVIVAGDSAGGNLAAGLVLQCIQHAIPKPDHLVAIYPSLLCNMYPSASRLICLIDPLVMFPCLLRCLNSYADQDYKKSLPRTFEQEILACKTNADPLLSPLLAPVELFASFPPTLLITSDIDPCLDETVEFSNKLYSSGAKVELEVFSGLPHGFLSLHMASKDCQNAVDFVSSKFLDMLLC